MAERGAPLGNQNAAKSRRFEQALERAITQDDGQRLRKAAENLLDLAAAGEAWAVKELRDTLDGKPTQRVEGELNVRGWSDVLSGLDSGS